MNHLIKYFLLAFIMLLNSSGFSQSKEYKPGDMIKENLQLFDSKGSPLTLKIPDETYLIYYRYSWKDIGKGIETNDSAKLMQEKIEKILDEGEMNKLKVYCISYDRKQDFAAWQEHINKNPPFKPSTRYTVDYVNVNGDSASRVKCAKLLSKVTAFGDDGKLLNWSSYISRFKFTLYGKGGFKGALIKAKILSDIKGVKTPLENTIVLLSNNAQKDTLSKSKSDVYGDFELHVPANTNGYTIKVGPVDEKIDNLHIQTQSGKEISTMEKTPEGFQYHLLKADIVTLAEIHEEDIKLKYETLKATNKKEFTIDENIFYETGKSHVQASSKLVLDKVTKILEEDPNVQLVVISHTDARGDEKSNLLLSEKRAIDVIDYLIVTGISAKRLKAIGKGEREIRNRCFNDINCSDKEHEYNRRTEFKFIRP